MLLAEAELPDAEAFAAAWKSLGPKDVALSAVVEAESATLSWEQNRAILTLIDAPVPGGEAEEAAERSASRFMGFGPPGEHSAHLAVVVTIAEGASAQAEVAQVSELLAVICEATEALGVYWSDAGASHSAEFVIDVRRSEGAETPVWCGVSYALPEGRPNAVSFVSTGMRQLGLLEIEVTVPEAGRIEAFEFLLNLASYVSQQGRNFEVGETTGRTDDEQLPIRRVPSPFGEGEEVCRIDLP